MLSQCAAWGDLFSMDPCEQIRRISIELVVKLELHLLEFLCKDEQVARFCKKRQKLVHAEFELLRLGYSVEWNPKTKNINIPKHQNTGKHAFGFFGKTAVKRRGRATGRTSPCASVIHRCWRPKPSGCPTHSGDLVFFSRFFGQELRLVTFFFFLKKPGVLNS